MRKTSTGFTLIELITVIVILGILGALGVGFFISFLKSYDSVQLRSKLIAKGRVVVEQMTRRMRAAVPNSVRVSSSGNCIEFMPVVAAANYTQDLPDLDNGASGIASLSTSSFSTNLGVARHALAGALFSSEIYTSANPAARVSITPLSGGPFSAINFSTSHVFIRNSLSQRIFLADHPIRFCYVPATSQMFQYSAYGLDSGILNDAVPSGAVSSLMSDNVSAQGAVFSLSPGSEDRNTVVNIALVFSQQTETVVLTHKVYIRNVP